MKSEYSTGASNGATKREAISSRGLEMNTTTPLPPARDQDNVGKTQFDEDFLDILNGDGAGPCTLDGIMTLSCKHLKVGSRSGAYLPAELGRYQHEPNFSVRDAGLELFIWEYYVPRNDEDDPLPPSDQTIKRGYWERGMFDFSWQSQTKDVDEEYWYRGSLKMIPRRILGEF